MKKQTISVLIFCLGVSLVSCTQREKSSEKILNLAVPQKVKGMDPIHSSDLYSATEVARVYEGLLEYNHVNPYLLVPNLAEGMPLRSEDGLTYTFKIRSGILFHDDPAFPNGEGRELVAQDFVYSIKRLADLRLQGLGWWTLDGKIKGLNEWREKYRRTDKTNYDEEVTGLRALDKYTLQLILTKPFPQLLYVLAMPFSFAVAREVVEHYGEEFLNHPVGTGAFTLGEFDQSNRIVYERNKKFREKTFPCNSAPDLNIDMKFYCGKKIPFVDKVMVNIIQEDQPRWLNFQRGRLDYIGVPKDSFESLIPDGKTLSKEFAGKGISLIVAPSLDITYTGFNHDEELFQNKKLRQAMSLAYDHRRANELFYNNTAILAHSIIPPGIEGHMKDFVSPYKYLGEESIAKAKQLMSEVGYPEGRNLPEMTLDIPASTSSRQMADYFKTQMERINIKVRVIQNTWPELLKKITTRQIQLYSIAWSGDYPDSENFFKLLYGPNRSPGSNGSGYNNEDFNRLYEEASVLPSSPARKSLYEKMYQMAAEEVPLLFNFHRRKYVVIHSWIKNYVVSDFSLSGSQYIDVDINKKQEMIKEL